MVRQIFKVEKSLLSLPVSLLKELRIESAIKSQKIVSSTPDPIQLQWNPIKAAQSRQNCSVDGVQYLIRSLELS